METRLDYSHRDVSSVPEEVIRQNKTVTVLDISNNQISDVTFISGFTNINSLILDHNKVTSNVVFPFIPSLTTLWLNFNAIDRLVPFVDNLIISFPNLRHLSLMGNLASPPCTEDTYYDYVTYRLVVLSRLSDLEYLDDRPITQHERDEARRLYNPNSDSTLNGVSNLVNSFVNKVVSLIEPDPEVGTRSYSRASVI